MDMKTDGSHMAWDAADVTLGLEERLGARTRAAGPLRRGRSLVYGEPPMVDENDRAEWRTALVRPAAPGDAVVKEGGPSLVDCVVAVWWLCGGAKG